MFEQVRNQLKLKCKLKLKNVLICKFIFSGFLNNFDKSFKFDLNEILSGLLQIVWNKYNNFKANSSPNS